MQTQGNDSLVSVSFSARDKFNKMANVPSKKQINKGTSKLQVIFKCLKIALFQETNRMVLSRFRWKL